MLPATGKTTLPYQPILLKSPPSISPSSSQTLDPTPAQKNVSPARVKAALERPLHVVSKSGEPLGTINLPVFLRHVYQYLNDIKCPPKHFDATGGAVAYLIGPQNAKKYADLEGISNPDLSEFDRLKDLDISVDLSEHSQDVLFSMCYCVIKALQKSGIHTLYSELNDTVFIRKIVTSNKDLCILSIGDPNSFWVDFSFIIRGRKHLFVRDNIKCNLVPYLLHKKYDLTWTTTAKNPMQPIRNRLEKKLDMDEVESINYLGFPLALYYETKGYQISEPDNLKPLAQKFIDFHDLNKKSYAETYDNIRKNHIGENLDIYVSMVVACLRGLLPGNNPQLMEWIDDTQIHGDTPECRFFNFIKNGGMETYGLSPSDVFCVADLMGVKPKIPFPIEAWTNFLQKKIIFSEQDSWHLFSSTDAFPLLLAKRIQQNALTVPSLSTQALLDLLETYNFNKDKDAFLEIKFDWECTCSPLKALEMLKNYGNTLPVDKRRVLLRKIFTFNCSYLQPYLPSIFSEAIDDILWIDKLLNENFPEEAILLAFKRNTKDIYTFLLEKFFASNRLKDFAHTLHHISENNPPMHKELMQYSAWQEKFSQYLCDESDFKNKLRACLNEGDFPIVENLLKMSAGKYLVPAEDMEKILHTWHIPLFQKNDFETLEFLFRLSIGSKVKAETLSSLCESLLSKLVNANIDPLKAAWAINFFSHHDLAPFISHFAHKFIQLASSCLDIITENHAEAILKITLDAIPSSTAPEVMIVLRHCMQTLQFRKKDLGRLAPKLSSTSDYLIKSKDASRLLILLKEIRALKLKLPFAPESLSGLLEVQASPKDLFELSKLLDVICPLPEDVKRPLIEKYLLDIAMAKPKQALSVFEDNLFLWKGSKESLKAFFNQLTYQTLLRYSVFFHIRDWRLEDWQTMTSSEGLDENSLLKLFIDPRARKFIDTPWIRYFIFTKNSSIGHCHKILGAFPLPNDKEFLIDYLHKLKAHGFPVEESHAFLKKFLKLGNTPEDPSVISGIKLLLESCHQKSPHGLIDTIFDLEPFLGQLPEKEKQDFAASYLNCLPTDFQDELYDAEERACLNHLIDTFEIQSSFSVYLGLTDSSIDKIERALKLLVEKKLYAKDRHAIKKALACLSRVLSHNPQFWISVGDQFMQNYLSEKNVKFNSSDIIKILSDTDFPLLQYLLLSLALDAEGLDRAKLILSHLESLINQGQFDLVNNLMLHPHFLHYLQNGFLSGSFKKMTQAFLIKFCIYITYEPDDTKKINAFKSTLPKIPLCQYKDTGFDKVWHQMAKCIGHCMLGSVEPESYCSLICEFSDLYSRLYGWQELNHKARSSLTKGVNRTELAGKDSPKISILQFEILKVLFTYLAPFLLDTASRKKRLDFTVQLLKNTILKLHPKAYEEFHDAVMLLFQNFFKSPGLYQNVELTQTVFDLLSEALKSQIYTGAYAMLLKTANCFSGLTFIDNQLTELWLASCIQVFNFISDDKSFANCWEGDNVDILLNVNTIQDYVLFLNNLIYTLLPTHPCFDTASKSLASIFVKLTHLRYPCPASFEIVSWRLYLGLPHGKLNEKLFIIAMESIMNNFPKAIISMGFGRLISRFYIALTSSNLNVTQLVLTCLSKLLGMLPIETATASNVIAVEHFMQYFLLYCETHMNPPETLGPALTNSILKWLLPTPQDEIDAGKLLSTLRIINKISESKLSKGSSLILFGSLRKLTEYICSHYPKTSDTQLDDALLQVLILILNPMNAPDHENSQLWEPVIFNICEKIINTIGGKYAKRIVLLFLDSQIGLLLKPSQVEKLCATLINN